MVNKLSVKQCSKCGKLKIPDEVKDKVKNGESVEVEVDWNKINTYATNVLLWETGGLNIDGCRIEHDEPVKKTDREKGQGNTWNDDNTGLRDNPGDLASPSQKGRWPANVILDPQSAQLVDRQSGKSKSGKRKEERNNIDDEKLYGNSRMSGLGGFGDEGGASRFFYSAKAHKSERNVGLKDLEDRELNQGYPSESNARNERQNKENDIGLNQSKKLKNDIATLKPINLCRWLCRLVTPPDGTVLDPFAGSGSLGCACEIEGFDYILIEKRERFAEVIAPKRIEYWSNPQNWDILKNHPELEDLDKKRKKETNKSLFDFG